VLVSNLRQVNLRISASALDVLESAVFVRELRSVQELLQPLVEAQAHSLETDPEIKAAVGLRLASRRKRQGNVRRFPETSGARPTGGDGPSPPAQS
jgi:hypothetical protein